MFRFYCIAIALAFFNFTSNGQTTVILNPVKDNTIFEDAKSNSLGAGENFFAGNTGANRPRRALLKFDIAAQVPAGASISDVSLSLFCNKVSIGALAYNMNIRPLTADWGEGGSIPPGNDGSGIAATVNDATWLNRFFPATPWGTSGGDFVAVASAITSVGDANASYTWTSPQTVADVQAWLNNPATNFGWILIGDETTAFSAKRFSSRENTIAAQRPQLSITYTTAPVAVIYTFSGTGNWDIATNWSNNAIPPASLPTGDEIIIDPLATGECILNVPQTILPGAKITVQSNKKFTIAGNLTIQ